MGHFGRAAGISDGACSEWQHGWKPDELTADFWPDALKPLVSRARASWIDHNLNGQPSAVSDYRLTVNCEWSFKGSGRR